MDPKLEKLTEVPEKHEFPVGTRLRVYDHEANHDYYEYLLTYVPWHPDAMLLVNVTPNNVKAGFVYTGMVPIERGDGLVGVRKSGLRHTLGSELLHWYLVVD